MRKSTLYRKNSQIFTIPRVSHRISMKECANETECARWKSHRVEKGNWNEEKNAKSAARGEIAIESGDEKSPQWQEETRVALLKDPYHRAVTRSFLDRSRTALVYHGADFFVCSISRRYRLASQRGASRRDAPRRVVWITRSADRDSRNCHAKKSTTGSRR